MKCLSTRLFSVRRSSISWLHVGTLTPSRSVLNCAADVPRKKDIIFQANHKNIFVAVMEQCSNETLVHKTGFGTEVIHQLVARGHVETLKVVLNKYRVRLGAHELAALINQQVGPQRKGAVDTGLSSCMQVVPLLKEYGGVEQTRPPDDWKPDRRRAAGGEANARSDNKESGGFWDDRRWGVHR